MVCPLLSNQSVFEKEVIILVQKILDERTLALKSCGLTFSAPKLNRIILSGKDYQSEIVIDFYGNGSICDVIEFFVYREGKPIASKIDIEAWLKESLDDVVKRKLGQK